MAPNRGCWHHGPVETPASSQPRRVLLVDDCEDLRTLMRILLEFEGHIVHEAIDGPAAIDAVMNHDFDIAFVDVGLPGLNGYEVARRIRATAPGRRLSLVALTGYGTDEDRRKAFEAGFDEHLIKASDHERVAALVARPPRRQIQTA